MAAQAGDRLVAALAILLSCFAIYVYAADCQIAVVGSPYNDCFDIYTAAGITAAQFASYNPGLDCSLLQPGEKVCISPGTLPSNAPSAFPNGTCAMYTTVSGDFCAAIAVKFDIAVDDIETWNAHTYKWNGCNNLQVDFTMCVSSGNPPPIPVDPNLQCGPASPGNATCPLRACCSAFGFCGLTADFCTTAEPNPCISSCFTPTLPSCDGSKFGRNIGYWSSWAARRPCAAYTPSQADWSGYTHAHFAFATITQDSQLLIADEDKPLLDELVSVKHQVPGLKVVLAVGGWDFSEDDPTRDLFSVMISTSSTRGTFISSVKSALSTYGLDGIDIDFEYPGAVERNAPATDTPNLTAFFSELRSALPSAIISVAAPAGYWFLRGFEIDKIASSVTYINMMSYDYHGPWDTNVTDQAPVTNPHTSVLDMHDSALLYIRAGIDLSIVNLGLAWYGRTYHLADPSCVGYNCTMVSGGAAGACTGASGILAQFELLDILQQGRSATLDSPSETYWFDDKNGDLITFDQADTWAAKQKFAKGACFGGSFVWSLDQVFHNASSSGGSSSNGSFSLIPWNPNPHPVSSASSATFVAGGTTVAIPVPTTATTVTVGGHPIALGPGGTPINSLIPTDVTQPGAVIPTWTYNILPPSSAATVTFTAPLSGFPTYSSAAQAPTAAGAPPRTVTGPLGDSNCDGSNQWILRFGPSIDGCLPNDVGVFGGTTPSAIPPPGWTGVWTNPVPPFSVTVVGKPAPSYTYITWNPNPYPPPTAVSETLTRSGSTTIIPIPTATTTVVLGNETVILGPGGTPEVSLLPSDIIILGGIIPSWTHNILPPPGATSVEFTAPLTSTPTYSTAVPIPTKTSDPKSTVTGPPGDHSRCGLDNIWNVLFGGIIDGCLPLDVGIINGITPYPLKPPTWTDPWTNPYPLETGGPPEDGEHPTSTMTSTSESSSSSSSSSTGACRPAQTTAYTLPGDSENDDWDDLGTDPNFRRRKRDSRPVIARAQQINPRHISMDGCPNLVVQSPSFVALEQANIPVPYYHVDEHDVVNTNLLQDNIPVGSGRPNTGFTIQEHVFELGYIRQFFNTSAFGNGASRCTWLSNNIFDYSRIGSTETIAAGLIAAIDNYSNLVWADVPMNQAKSNVVNNNRAQASQPPMQNTFDFISHEADFSNKDDVNEIWMAETFVRSFAALGAYFDQTSGIFASTATEILQILAEITPDIVLDDSRSLPLLFYNWLSTTVADYPSGCVSRATNVFNYYKMSMGNAASRQGLPSVPPCFGLYWQQNIPISSFNYLNLLPPMPESSQCHVPGSSTRLLFESDDHNQWSNQMTYTMMGIGSIYYYAIGSGTSMDGSHLQFTQGTTGVCDGVYFVEDGPANQGGTTVGFEVDCPTNLVFAVHILDPQNPQSVVAFAHCDLLVLQGSGFTLICGPDQTSVNQCSSSAQQTAGIGALVYIRNVGIYLQ